MVHQQVEGDRELGEGQNVWDDCEKSTNNILTYVSELSKFTVLCLFYGPVGLRGPVMLLTWLSIGRSKEVMATDARTTGL